MMNLNMMSCHVGGPCVGGPCVGVFTIVRPFMATKTHEQSVIMYIKEQLCNKTFHNFYSRYLEMYHNSFLQ